MTGGRRAKKREFSKTIISTVGAVTKMLNALKVKIVLMTGDTSPHSYQKPRVITEK